MRWGELKIFARSMSISHLSTTTWTKPPLNSTVIDQSSIQLNILLSKWSKIRSWFALFSQYNNKKKFLHSSAFSSRHSTSSHLILYLCSTTIEVEVANENKNPSPWWESQLVVKVELFATQESLIFISLKCNTEAIRRSLSTRFCDSRQDKTMPLNKFTLWPQRVA